MYTPVNPSFTIQKWDVKGYELHGCVAMMLNLAVADTVKQSSCAVALDTTYEMSKLVKFSPKRGSLLEKLKQELAPETPGFRTLCPDETRRGVEIVVEDLQSYVYSWYIYYSGRRSQLKRLNFWPKTHPKCIKTHSEAPLNQNFIGGDPPNPPYERGHPPLVLSPSLCLPPDHFQIRGDGPVNFMVLFSVQFSACTLSNAKCL